MVSADAVRFFLMWYWSSGGTTTSAWFMITSGVRFVLGITAVVARLGAVVICPPGMPEGCEWFGSIVRVRELSYDERYRGGLLEADHSPIFVR